MSRKISIGTEEIDLDELDQRIPELGLNVPCCAKGGDGEDGVSGPSSSVCHVFDNLSRWNYVLWHVGLQLREFRVPGRLSLELVVYKDGGGRAHQARSRDARILFHVLLVRHGCVESLHLDEALVEGAGLGECRELVVSALRQNTSLQALTVWRLYEYTSVRSDLFEAIGTMTNLRELALDSTLPRSFVQDALCPLLVATTCLTTLSTVGIFHDDETGKRLSDALLRNETVETLSVQYSILNTGQYNERSVFCDFLANSTRLTSLSVQGVPGCPFFIDPIIKSIVSPLFFSTRLRKLRLCSFRLSADCAALLAYLVSRQGCLEILDIGDCLWSPKDWLERCSTGIPADDDREDQTCLWMELFDFTAPVQLSFMALGCDELKLHELRDLLNTAVAIESLKTVSLRNVPLDELKAVCRVIREAGMLSRVHIEELYYVDSSTLSNLQEYPEALSKVVIRSFAETGPQAFAEAVQLACYCYRVTMLELQLDRGFLSNVLAFRKLSEYLSTAVSLRQLWLTGRDEAHLGRTLRSAKRPYSVLLDLIFKNSAIRILRITDFRVGEENLRFLADEVCASKTLCWLIFSSVDNAENDTFVRLIAAKFRDNMTMSYLNVLERTDCVDDEWFVIEDVISRNTGHLTCAAHYILGKDRSPRCAAAFDIVRGTNALMSRVDDLKQQV